MTKRKVQFSEHSEEAEDGRPEQKSRRFKEDEDDGEEEEEEHKEKNHIEEKEDRNEEEEVEIEGRWVEVSQHPKKRHLFSCTECVRDFSAAESNMKHFHWCDPNTKLVVDTATPTSSSSTPTPTASQKKRQSLSSGKSKQKSPAPKKSHLNETPKKPLLADVKDEVKDMITRVTPESVHQTERRGADTRKKYTNIEKLRIINEVYNGGKPVEVAYKYGINRSLISKWLSKKDILLEAIQSSEKKCFDTKNRRNNKYEHLYKELHTQCLAAEAQGVVISYRWIFECAEKIYREYFPGGILPQSFVSNFTKRFDLQYQKKHKHTKKSNVDVDDDGKSNVRWHSNSRQVPGTDKYSPKSSEVPLSFTLNYDQIEHSEGIAGSSHQVNNIPEANPGTSHNTIHGSHQNKDPGVPRNTGLSQSTDPGSVSQIASVSERAIPSTVMSQNTVS